MIKRTFVFLFSFVLLVLAAVADDDVEIRPPNAVQDLRYGVVLYHFFQQSYFEALTEAMVGEQRNDMPYHQQASTLLRGGMSLSYGMGNQAEQIFADLLQTLQQESDRDRAWFYLGKLYYLRGEKSQAQQVLANIEQPLAPLLQEEYIFLSANLLLGAGEFLAAETKISELPNTSPWLAYYLFNKGSSETLSGNWRNGVSFFQQLGALELVGDEGNTLKDKAYIASGFSHLGGSEFESAIKDFLKVRLDSPLVERAMLGYGWAAAQQQDFELALSPWQALSRRSVMSPSVQESLLAIPYAYEKLDARASALVEYQRAVSVYEKELSNLASAINVIRSMPLLNVLAQDDAESGDWIGGRDYLPINDQAPYLAHLIAQDHFQMAVKELSDLTTMQQYLWQAEQRLSAMQAVLSVQQQAWQDNLSQTQRDSYRQRYEQLLVLQQQLQSQQKSADQEANGRRLVSQEERALWTISSNAERRINSLQLADYDVSEEKEQLRLFQGLLYWQASEEDSSRRWRFKKSLAEVEDVLQETKVRLELLEQLDVNRYDEKFSFRIENMLQRLAQQQLAVDESLLRSEQEIRALAINELENQQQRLSYYLGQAKLAIARLYDAGSEGAW